MKTSVAALVFFLALVAACDEHASPAVVTAELEQAGLVGGQFCFDNNSNVNDGCANGTVQPGYTCFVGLNGLAVCDRCGNGVDSLSSKEQCDDSNVTSGDGCSSTCTIEPGWTCPPGVRVVVAPPT